MRQGIIAAVSTPPGKGGVAIIRVSGEGAHELVKRMFIPMKRDIESYPARHQIYGYIVCKGERVDDGMLTLFRAPNTYTGEDMAEISCHGGILITRTVLEELFVLGALPAEAGEFTRRAFVMGKLTLTEAEGIGNLLEAVTHEQIRLSAAPARTRLSLECEKIREHLKETLSSIFARIDYPEEDLGDFTTEQTLERLEFVRDRLSSLASTYKTGKAILEGVRTVIVGKPNAGKSTLYNTVLGEDAAIVTDIKGTTRDLLTARAALGRVTLCLTDTAGIRDTAGLDTVEKIGIERTKEALRRAELVIAVFDTSLPLSDEDFEILGALNDVNAPKICILNKADRALKNYTLPNNACEFDGTLTVSLKDNKEGALTKLSELTDKLFCDQRLTAGEDAIISSARQHSAVLRALDFIDTAIGAYRLGLPHDAASSDIELALGAIGELDGRAVAQTVTDGIFKHFCVGK